MHKFLKKLWKEIEELPHQELFDLLKEYDKYVIEVTDREDGSVPVCVLEFYQNEYQDIRKQKGVN